MAYVVFIERLENPILLDEWRAFCDRDPWQDIGCLTTRLHMNFNTFSLGYPTAKIGKAS